MRSLVQNVTLVIVSAFLSLTVVEAALRLHDGVPVFSFDNLLAKRIDQLSQDALAQYDPLLGWVQVPNVTKSQSGVTYTFGDQGIRMNGPEIEPLATGAVLAVGDSFTAGSEVNDGETWPAHLERILGEPVINAATGGWGTDQMILRAETLLPRLKPRRVIVGIMVDDILRAQFEFRSGAYKPVFVIEDGELVHRNHPVPRYAGSRYEVGWLRSFLGHFHLVNWMMERIGYTEWWSKWDITYRWAHQEGDKVTCRLLERLKRRLDADEAELVVLFQYGASHIRGWSAPPPYQESVEACAQDLGVTVVDLWEDLREVQATDEAGFCALFVQQGDCGTLGHMSSSGNRFVATRLSRALAQ